MDEGDGLSLLPVQGNIGEGHCESCTMVRASADSDDDDVVVVSRPDLPGVLVVAPWHVNRSSRSCRSFIVQAFSQQSNVLTGSVTARSPGSAPRIVALTDLTASEGHLCLQVMPCASEDTRDGAGCV